ncbi:Replication protein A subunit [Mycena chlorophos]|uniref:Replication protein A subunit n=1 Tax=Mycena chlorophos TaxID=658473 RepID=A0A8H6TSS0_MYCCL|nr:Replication protein A subunit [Mycena chlorophos]
MVANLSQGGCKQLHSAGPDDVDIFEATYTLQVLSVKSVANNTTTGQDRFRIIVSDGINFVQAMLATQLNSLVAEESIKKHTILSITKMTCNFVQDKRLLIILSLHVVEQSDVKVGDPQPLDAPKAAAASSTTPTASTSLRPAQSSAAQSKPAPQRAAPSAAATNQAQAHGSIYPIEGLSPYQNNWTIKARVTQKSDLKTYSNQRGEGNLFNVTLMDDTGEIRATAFNAVALELYDKLVEGKVYYISKARVNFAKKQFSHLSNEYELGFEKSTMIEECLDLTNAPTIKYNFVPLDQLETIAKDATCDVIAIVKEATETNEIYSKASSRNITKRELTLVDQSQFQVRMTLWGKQAENFSSKDQVIAFRNVKVGDFGGRSLSFFSSSSMSINPSTDEAFELRGWYDSAGKEQEFKAYASSGGGGAGGGGPAFKREEIKSIMDIKAEGSSTSGDKAQYFSARATLLFVKHENMWYPACKGENCNKKVAEAGGEWSCESCQKKWPSPEYRYIMSLACADHSEQAWLQGFNDVGEVIFDHRTATDLHQMKEDEGENKFQAFVQEHSCETYNFTLRAKLDEYNGQSRVRYGISKIMPIDYKEEMKYMRDQLLGDWGQTAV